LFIVIKKGSEMMRNLFVLLCLFATIAQADNRAFQNNDLNRNVSIRPGDPEISGVVMFPPDLTRYEAGPLRDRVGPNRLVSDEDRTHQNESASFVNPNNPQHVIGGCNDYRGDDVRCGYYVTFDGGRTWEDGVVEDIDGFGASGDPSVAIDNDGNAYMCGIAFNRDDDFGGIYVSKSEDGGTEWGEPNWVIVHREGENNPPFEDKCYVGIDNSDSEYEGNIYVSWTRFGGESGIYFSRSEDGGEEWSDPLNLTRRSSQGSVPTVGPDGELYVIWKDYTADRVIGRKSDDGGESFEEIFVVANTDAIPRRLDPTEFRVNSFPSPAVDCSDGENSGRVYVTWADHRSGDADILLAYSDDGADNWTDPIRLNDDEAENGLDQFFPWIAVDPVNGHLYAVWYDRRLDEDNIFVDLYGVRWNGLDEELPDNERISSESFDPRIGFGGAFIGDYNGIAAGGGLAHPAWCDTRNNNQDVFWAPFMGERHFWFEEREFDHIYIIDEVLINGEPGEEGDEIAAVEMNRRRPRWGQTILNAVVIEDDAPYEIPVFGSYSQWRVWDDSEMEEIVSAWEVVEEGEGETVLRLVAPPPDTVRIELNNNWSLVSLPINPISVDPIFIFSAIENAIGMVKNGRGRFYVPSIPFNNMGPISPFEGYQVRVIEETVLIVPGIRLDPQEPVPLRENWNFAAYLPDYELDPWDGFESILDNMLIAKNGRGRFMVPSLNFSNIDRLIPGEAYQIRMSEADELIYPEEGE